MVGYDTLAHARIRELQDRVQKLEWGLAHLKGIVDGIKQSSSTDNKEEEDEE